jgi:hypothetical protein
MFEEGLSRFGGAILSPLNYKPAEIAAQLEQLKYRQGFVTLFDPHLYRPQSGVPGKFCASERHKKLA